MVEPSGVSASTDVVGRRQLHGVSLGPPRLFQFHFPSLALGPLYPSVLLPLHLLSQVIPIASKQLPFGAIFDLLGTQWVVPLLGFVLGSTRADRRSATCGPSLT